MEEDLTILTAEEMREKYFPSLSDGQDTSLGDYMTDLASRGITLNPKLFPSKFHLKNGLPYTGMATKQKLGGGEVLIRVPEELILSADKARLEPQLADVFNERFFYYENSSQVDEDRVLIVYSLFVLYTKDQKNVWYQMVKRFPQQCDIASFWSQDELLQFKDKTVKSAANIQLEQFQKEWAKFQQIQKKYEILQYPEFNEKNYTRFYITLSNRAFGNRVKYTSLVPMAEYFNHHSSKVYYSLEKDKETHLNDEKPDESQTSSLGSCESREFIEQDQFDYDRFQLAKYDWQPECLGDLSCKQQQKVLKELNQLVDELQEQLSWKDFSVLFIGHLIHKILSLKKEYLEGRKPYERVLEEIKIITKTIENFKKQVEAYYKETKNKEYMPAKVKKQPEVKFVAKQSQKQYESLILKTTKFDHIEPNNQVYFRYGHNCNRTLLTHYGFAIEGNKYEHCYVSFNIAECMSYFPDTLQKVMEKKVSLLRKFKVYGHRLNLDMIIFFRLNSWTFYGQKAVQQIFSVTSTERQIAILQQIVGILQEYIQIYDDQYDLTDKSLNYHQYFTAVYHKQKLRILRKQVKLLNLVIHIINEIDNGSSLKKAVKNLTPSERTVLENYLKTIRV